MVMYEDAMKKNVSIVPGNKICTTCIKKIQENVSNEEDNTERESLDEEEHISADEQGLPGEIQSTIDDHNLSTCLQNIGISPIKVHALSYSGKKGLGKRKLKDVVSTMHGKIAKTLNVNSDDINIFDESQHMFKHISDKAESYDRLLLLVKEKIDNADSTSEKIKFLTLAPDYWPIKMIQEYFNVTEYCVRKSRCIFKEKGILYKPDKKIGNKIDENTALLVKQFYEDDKYSRIMPGAKDFVSIAKNQHMQKRLLLSNLKELYSSFKNEYPDAKIGFSKFSQMKPKWCVLPGAKGTH